MKKYVVTVLVALLIGGTIFFWINRNHQNEYQHNLLAKLLATESELSETKNSLSGYMKFTDYLTESKKAIEGQMKFLAAKVDREYTLVEHLQKSTFGLKTNATIIVIYTVEYSFGYDLKPDSFTITGDKEGISITLNRPELVASPAVKIISHDIASKGVLIDEKAAIIALQQQLPTVALNRAKEIQKEEAVIALCEKKLSEFMRDFISKQPNVKLIPAIKFIYK